MTRLGAISSNMDLTPIRQVVVASQSSDLTLTSSMQDVPGLSVTMTTTGGRVIILCSLQLYNNAEGDTLCRVDIDKDAGATVNPIAVSSASDTLPRMQIPVVYTDVPTAASHTWKLIANEDNNRGILSVFTLVRMIAVEL
jgi:hypothetical protein